MSVVISMLVFQFYVYTQHLTLTVFKRSFSKKVNGQSENFGTFVSISNVHWFE